MAEPLDILIVGGGPAGQAAALRLSSYGLSIAVVDEQPQPGGQILRQPPASFEVRGWLRGKPYAVLKRQLARFETASGITWLGGRSVLGLSPIGDDLFGVTIASAQSAEQLTARRVLIAAGCQDLAVPVPGWTLPGVYAAGGIQAFVKSQRFVPGKRIVLAGTHPLQLLIAAQIVEAGGSVGGIFFAQSRATMARALLSRPATAASHFATLAPAIAALHTLRRHRVPVHFGASIQAIFGNDQVESVVAGGERIACDAVGLCFGFVPQSALPRMIGARVRPAGYAGGWAAVSDRWMRSSIRGLFVAGETTGVAGAMAAISAGEIAGIGMAFDLALIEEKAAEQASAAARARHATSLRFANLLDRIADPHRYFPAIQPETPICRCEKVSLEQIEPLIGSCSANGVKLATRCGMGVCQGRNCEPTLLRLMGNADDPGFAARFPARPVTIADLAATD